MSLLIIASYGEELEMGFLKETLSLEKGDCIQISRDTFIIRFARTAQSAHKELVKKNKDLKLTIFKSTSTDWITSIEDETIVGKIKEWIDEDILPLQVIR